MMDRINKVTDANAKNRESVIEFIWEVICCLLLSVGTCYLLDAQFPLQTGISAIFLHCAVTLTVVAVATRRWWLFLASVGVGVVASVIWMISAGVLGVALEYAVGFFSWWLHNLPQDSEWFNEHNLNLVHLLIHIGVSVGFFALLRIIRRVWPTLIICIVIIGVVLTFGEAVNNSVAVAFYAAGILPLFAKEHFSGRRLFARKNKVSVLGKRWVVVTVSGVLCIAVAAGTFFALPEDTKNVRTRAFSNITADLQTATELYTTEQQTAINITLHDLGLQYSPHYIGGNLKPIDSAVIATTDSTEPLLIKITSYDTYDGIRWKDTFDKNYRVNGIWQDEEISMLSGPITEDEAWMDRIFKFAELKDVTITLTTKSNILATVGQTISVTENTKTKNPILFNERGELFSYFELPQNYSYTLSYLAYPTKTDIGESNYQTMLGASSAGGDPIYDNPEFYDHYTALPKGYSKAAEALVNELIPEAKGLYEVAFTISDYFSNENGFFYSSSPGWIVEGENVVDKLFETGKGHCGYFATAMITMARAMGIPSRLAAGYKTVASADGKYQVVDVSSPYCWVECYIRNMGWIAFDPTPAPKSLKPIKKADGTDNSITIEDIEEILDDFEDEEAVPEEVEPGEPTYSTYKFPIFKFLAIVLAVILAYLILRTLLFPLFYSLPLVKLRFRSNNKRARYYYRDILRQLKILGFEIHRGETLKELLCRLGPPVDDELKAELMEKLTTIERMNYNGEMLTSNEVSDLFKIRKKLDRRIRKKNALKYILLRKTLLPIINIILY
ncbi:MAG: transglutaminase domain-containing protein [Clostridia bacterium]|nr:transglutaminase domain-containing protein [Clostridia bacterium]